MVLQQACKATAAWLNLDAPTIPVGFCQSLLDMSLSYSDPMALLHGLSIWLFPDIPLTELDAIDFEERIFDTVAQEATAPDMTEMKKHLKLSR